jgi:hypothetical protein
MLSQSGLTPQDRADIEHKLVFTAEAPQAAAAFKAAKVDAAVTWEPDLSGAVSARPDDAHILVSTSAATNVIADTLVAREQVVEQAPKTLQSFVAGWFDGIAAMKDDPQGTNQMIATALKLSPDDVSGMLAGLKLTPFADNAQFYGLSGQRPYFDTLFNAAFVIWRKKGVITKVVEAGDWRDSHFVAGLGDQYNTYLKIEGNTDSRGSATVNKTLSQRRAESVKAYLGKNFAIPTERFVAVGRGAENPIASNSTEDGRALNRRTDIKVVLNAQ